MMLPIWAELNSSPPFVLEDIAHSENTSSFIIWIKDKTNQQLRFAATPSRASSWLKFTEFLPEELFWELPIPDSGVSGAAWIFKVSGKFENFIMISPNIANDAVTTLGAKYGNFSKKRFPPHTVYEKTAAISVNKAKYQAMYGSWSKKCTANREIIRWEVATEICYNMVNMRIQRSN